MVPAAGRRSREGARWEGGRRALCTVRHMRRWLTLIVSLIVGGGPAAAPAQGSGGVGEPEGADAAWQEVLAVDAAVRRSDAVGACLAGSPGLVLVRVEGQAERLAAWTEAGSRPLSGEASRCVGDELARLGVLGDAAALDGAWAWERQDDLLVARVPGDVLGTEERVLDLFADGPRGGRALAGLHLLERLGDGADACLGDAEGSAELSFSAEGAWAVTGALAESTRTCIAKALNGVALAEQARGLLVGAGELRIRPRGERTWAEELDALRAWDRAVRGNEELAKCLVGVRSLVLTKEPLLVAEGFDIAVEAYEPERIRCVLDALGPDVGWGGFLTGFTFAWSRSGGVLEPRLPPLGSVALDDGRFVHVELEVDDPLIGTLVANMLLADRTREALGRCVALAPGRRFGVGILAGPTWEVLGIKKDDEPAAACMSELLESVVPPRIGRLAGVTEIGFREIENKYGTADRPREEIDRGVKAQLDEVRPCYQELLDRNPEAAGRLKMRFVIGPEGKVLLARAAEKPPASLAEMVPCVQEAVLGMSFPPGSPGITPVEYPFAFTVPSSSEAPEPVRPPVRPREKNVGPAEAWAATLALDAAVRGSPEVVACIEGRNGLFLSRGPDGLDLAGEWSSRETSHRLTAEAERCLLRALYALDLAPTGDGVQGRFEMWGWALVEGRLDPRPSAYKVPSPPGTTEQVRIGFEGADGPLTGPAALAAQHAYNLTNDWMADLGACGLPLRNRLEAGAEGDVLVDWVPGEDRWDVRPGGETDEADAACVADILNKLALPPGWQPDGLPTLAWTWKWRGGRVFGD